ncbi:MAG: ORF6N domain-containing protein [Planctomycetota bacterium]
MVPVEVIERRIYLIRGQKVMLDSDLAALHQVETFNLNKAVKRNLNRFPEDFMFQLTQEEVQSLIFRL